LVEHLSGEFGGERAVVMNIYVGNLSYGMSEDELREAFGEFGEVSSVKILMDRETGRSRGFGFVEMPHQAEAESAIAQLNGKDLGGRALRINEARPREQQRR
jgi:RNA recognition motif-containing protein